ncbi:hypothetical protein [Pararhodobacter zhoushanensis]|uniref:Uncharacterized protein n=1 Tax=Pararhodobacter zhoushanensis TaxID=2479545 RepID=A0ABT3H5C4_9RHOB|nr:hypothetical protein [Pararhodobacter zhoushanensis]MCW1935001.1 hypothetical protein [Pararhodobacter zhoushanensis]
MDNFPRRRSAPSRAAALHRLAAVALAAAAGLTLADMLSHHHVFATAAAMLVIVHVGLCWPRIRTNARIMMAAALGLALIFIATGGKGADLALALSRAMYLPALLAVMAVLRVAAQRSEQVEVAAQFVVQQPPARRYTFLATGAHLLGILLNVGGYQLLLGIALGQRGAPEQSARAAEIRNRRIACAIMRGFNATVLWSPVGLAVNLLLPIMPTLDWFGYLPYGLTMLVVFSGLGWAMDRMGPRPLVPFAPPARDGAWAAILALLALVLAITGTAALLDYVFAVSMRAAVLMVIPVMALLWVMLTEKGPVGAKTATLGQQTLRALPDSANEIGLLAASGFLGLIVAQMIPPDAVRGLVQALSMGPGVVGALITVMILGLGMLGLSPMITGSAFVGAVVGAGLPMPEPMLMVATLGGWVGAAMLSPMTSTVAMLATATGLPSSVVGLRWNGVFALTFQAMVIVTLLVWQMLL